MLRVVTDDEAVARQLRDAGVEVIFTGPDQNPVQLEAVAVQEDADAVLTGTSLALEDVEVFHDARALLDWIRLTGI